MDESIYTPRSRTVGNGCIISPPMVIGLKVHLARRVEPDHINSVFDGFGLMRLLDIQRHTISMQ